MKSIRTKITILAVCIAVVAMTVATVIGAVSIKKLGDSSSEQILLLLCRTGKKNLDSYFESVEQSVTTVADFASADVESTDISELGIHVDRVRALFGKAAFQTHGVLTYYYRTDPAVSETVKGFWYINESGNGFIEHEVTDLTKYDTEKTDDPGMVWFTVPKTTGKSIWLAPYVTENLDVRVISYNVPIYRGSQFIGVVGIEIDYSTMKSEVDSISLYESGYAFINDSEGNIIYHPKIDVTTMSESEKPKAPTGLVSENKNVRYSFEGVEKQAVWLELSNGMRLNVTVPVSEINSGWRQMIAIIVIVSVGLLLLFVILTMHFSNNLTKPLRELTEAAEMVDHGNYDVILNHSSNDEVGALSRTFDRLIAHLKIYISDLNSLANTDALTAVSNKSAYDICIRDIQQKMNILNDEPRFAVAIFDCDDLKLINDRYGHDKGDLYLKNTSAMICHVFGRSKVFRIGGDEFAVILMDEDYAQREHLARLFFKKCDSTCEKTNPWWEQIRVSMGIADYDPHEDSTVDDVARRADKLMYENKHDRKNGIK